MNRAVVANRLQRFAQYALFAALSCVGYSLLLATDPGAAVPVEGAAEDVPLEPFSWSIAIGGLVAAALIGAISHALAFLLPAQRRQHDKRRLWLHAVASVLSVVAGYLLLLLLAYAAPNATPYSLNLALSWPYLAVAACLFLCQRTIEKTLARSAAPEVNASAAVAPHKITQLWIASPLRPWRRVTLRIRKNGVMVLQKPSLWTRKKQNILYVNIGSVGVETSWLFGATISINSVRWGERHLKVKTMPEREAERFADLVLEKIHALGGERR